MTTTNHPHSLQSASEAPEPRDARRRRELIEATIASIARNGLSGTTIAKVAEIANLSAGIVSFYFRTKEALLLATLEHLDLEFENRRLEVLDRAGDDPVRQLEAIIDVNFDPALCDAGRIAVWAAFWGESQARKSYQRVCGARDFSEEQQLVALFEQIAARGGGDQVDPRSLGLAFYHLLSSLPEAVLDDDREFDYEQAKQTCRNFLASVFPGDFSPDAVARSGMPGTPRVPTRSGLRHETLPAWVYRSSEFYELERENIFKRSWLMVGHANQVQNPGDYMTLDAVGERALVIRGNDRVLRAFHNVCRHRASRVVVDEVGHCAGSIACPYHGWSYGLDGKLRAVPAEKTFPGLEKDQLGLIELDLEQWMGIVFVRFAGDGPSVGSMMKEFEDDVRQYRIEEMKPWGRPISLSENFNWKLFAENDSEGYHVPKGHPGLRRLFGTTYVDARVTGTRSSRSYANLQDRPSSNWTERSYQRLLPEVSHLPEKLRRAWLYYGFNPTFGMQLTPDLVDCYQVLPIGPDRCRITNVSLALDDDRREMRAARYLNQRLSRQVTKEDVDFCYWTDGGLRTSGYPGGVLSELEFGVRDFQHWIRELLPVANRAEVPPTGTVSALNEGLKGRH